MFSDITRAKKFIFCRLNVKEQPVNDVNTVSDMFISNSSNDRTHVRRMRGQHHLLGHWLLVIGCYG